MGGGCFKHGNDTENASLLATTYACTAGTSEARTRLAPVFHAAGRAGSLSAPKLDEVLELLSSVPSSDTCTVFRDWLDRSTAKSRAGLALLMQRIIARAIEANVVVAEELIGDNGESGVVDDFVVLAERCREALRLDEAHQCAIMSATFALNYAALTTKGGSDGHDDIPAIYVVPAFDRIVLLFRHAFLAQLGCSAGNLRAWSEFMADTGLPQLEEHLALLSWNAKASLAGMLLIPEGVSPTTIVLNRDNALADAGSQLPESNACVLSPYFESSAGTKVVQGRRVEGGEGHGPRKEFFITTSADTLKKWGTPAVVMFEFHRGTGQQWFSAYAAEFGNDDQGQELRKRFRSFGKLLALAIANRCKISFTLPLMFFQLLLHREYVPVLADLKGFDNALHASLKKCLTMRQAQFNQLKEVEGLPESLSKEDYVADRVRAHLMPDGMVEVRQGFWALVRDVSVRGVSASDLRHIVCPTEVHRTDMDIRQIFTVVMEDEMAECAPFVDAFWSVVDGLSIQEKQQFLLFVTGVETPPERGTERLVIQLPFSAFTKEEHFEMLHKLPQAHTCTNTLELPNYHESLLVSNAHLEDQTQALADELKRVLGEKLRVAINESAGYELDAVEMDSAGQLPTGISHGHVPGHVHPRQHTPKGRGSAAQLHANIEGLLQEYELLVPHQHPQEYELVVPHQHPPQELVISEDNSSEARSSGRATHEPQNRVSPISSSSTSSIRIAERHDIDSLLEELQL